MSKEKLAVLVTKKNGNVHQVYRTKKNGFTISRKRAEGFRFDDSRKKEIRAWAAKRKYVSVEFTTKENPFVVYDTITSDGDEATGRVRPVLEKKLNAVGRDIKRKLFVGEGKRSAHAQWVFYMSYLNGQGNLAAPCCTKYYRTKHSWENCGKNSQSNHYTGDAADTVIMPSWSNIGTSREAVASMRRHGLGLPVGGENWHVEVSNSFYGL